MIDIFSGVFERRDRFDSSPTAFVSIFFKGGPWQLCSLIITILQFEPCHFNIFLLILGWFREVEEGAY